MNLTDEQKRELRIRVAELCGWEKAPDCGPDVWHCKERIGYCRAYDNRIKPIHRNY